MNSSSNGKVAGVGRSIKESPMNVTRRLSLRCGWPPFGRAKRGPDANALGDRFGCARAPGERPAHALPVIAVVPTRIDPNRHALVQITCAHEGARSRQHHAVADHPSDGKGAVSIGH